MGVGLIQLLKWIVEDELGMGQTAHLIPQVNIFQNCQLDSVQRNHVVGATSLMVLQMTLFQVEPKNHFSERSGPTDGAPDDVVSSGTEVRYGRSGLL